jgi:PLD-like domain
MPEAPTSESLATLIAEDGGERHHRRLMQRMLCETSGPLRVASPYITEAPLFSELSRRDVRVLTCFSNIDAPWEIISGSTTLSALRALIGAKAKCKFLCGGSRLHAKVYVFGTQAAVVTSANMTRSAFDENIEVGTCVAGDAVHQLIRWFDRAFEDEKAMAINRKMISRWEQNTVALRQAHPDLRRKGGVKTDPKEDWRAVSHRSYDLRRLFASAEQFFVCNTNRRNNHKDLFDQYTWEQEMRHRELATTWEDFNWPKYMDQVKPGAVILMYAKNAGIVAIGRATARCRRLPQPTDPDRIAAWDTPEWQVPCYWLYWVQNDREAYWWPSLNASFFEVTNNVALRKQVLKHFLNLMGRNG